MSHLENADRFVAIAEAVDGDPKKAKREAWMAAAKEFAAHQGKTGDSIRQMADCCNSHRDTIQKLLAWHKSGYKGDSPYARPDKDEGAARAHTKRVLRDPNQRKKAIGSLSSNEKAAVAKEVMSDPDAAVKVMKDPNARKAAEKAQDKEARERIRTAKKAAAQRQKPTPLSQFFWRIVSRMEEWRRDLTTISEDFESLTPEQTAQVIETHEMLIERAQRNVSLLEGTADDDVIEGTVVPTHALSA